MSRFGFCGPTYQSQSLNVDAQRCINLYPEADESGQGKSAVAMYYTPGLKQFAIFPAALSTRGLFTINGRTFAVASAVFAEVLSDGTLSHQNSVANDELPVSFASSATQLLLVSAGTAYVYDLKLNTLTPITTLLGVPAKCGYSDGFFIILLKNSQQIQISTVLDATSWPALITTIVSVFPDNLTSMIVDHRECWLFGQKATVPYFDSGNFFPFDVVPGGYIEQGCAALNSPARIDNSVLWLGGDERGNGIVWRAQGYTPVRISNFSVETALQSYSRIDDAVGYAYQDQGHSFYVLYFPTADKTWVFDVSMNMWHERTFLDPVTGQFHAHHSQCHTFNFGKHLVGDWASGVMYEMSIKYLDDAGVAIKRLRRAPHISTEQERMRHHSLQVDAEVGIASIASLGVQGSASFILFAHAEVAFYQVTMQDNGTLGTTLLPFSPTLVPTLILVNSQPAASSSWQLIVNTGGGLAFIAVQFSSAYPQGFNMTTASGLQGIIKASTVGAVQSAVMASIPLRAPQLMLRWSDDGAHTWSNEYPMSLGKLGETKVRAMRKRLGQSRDRVYEVSCSDPVPLRIVDAYLKASPGYQPQERLSRQFQKVT